MSEDTLEGVRTVNRARAAKLIAMLGSPNVGEQSNAFGALRTMFAMSSSGVSWHWLSRLAEAGELRSEEAGPVARDQLLRRLLVDRLDDGLAHAWAMPPGKAINLRELRKRCVDDRLKDSDFTSEIALALKVADQACVDAGVGGLAKKRGASR